MLIINRMKKIFKKIKKIRKNEYKREKTGYNKINGVKRLNSVVFEVLLFILYSI